MFKKRIGIYMICFALIASYLLGGAFMKKNETHAAVVLDWVATKALDSVFNVVNTVFLKGVDELSEYDNQGIQLMCQFIAAEDNLLFAGNAGDASKEILAELSVIETQISNVNTQIQSTLSEMFTYQIKHNENAIIGELDGVYDKQSKMVGRYKEYLADVNAYADAIVKGAAGTLSDDKVQQAKKNMEQKEADLKDDIGKEDFIKDLDEVLHDVVVKNTCAFYPSDSADPANKGNPNRSNLYLQATWDYLEETVPFEHQKYEQMTAAANDCAKDIVMLLRTARAWYDYQYLKYGDNPSKVNQLEDNAKKYGSILNQCIHALSDISEQCNAKVKGFMRPYDLNTSKEMRYKESGSYTVFYADIMPIPFHYVLPIHYKTTAKATRPTMDFYRVCVNGTPYLILNEKDPPQAANYVHSSTLPQYLQSQDYMNLENTKDGKYSMPNDYTEVIPITATSAYKGSGSNLTAYLKGQGELSQLPGQNVLYVPTRKIDEWGTFDYFPTDIGVHFNAHWCSTTINTDNMKKAEVTVNFNKIYHSADKVFSILVGSKNNLESSSVSVQLSDNRGRLSVTNEKGDPISSNVAAGTALNLNLKMKDGAELKSLKWVSKDGKTTETIADRNSIKLAEPEKDGSYTFTYPMSYQDCTFRADFTNAEEGEGTEENPYLIRSAQDLDDYQKLACDKETQDQYNKAHYKLANDIEIKDLLKYGFGTAKEGFTGTFDGAGHQIQWTSKSDGEITHIFERIGKGGVVKNLTISANGKECFGREAILAYGNEGTIIGCSLVGDSKSLFVNNSSRPFGVFAAVNEGTGVIKNCSNSKPLRGFAKIGGIAGENGGLIQNCYNSEEIYNGNKDSAENAGIVTYNRGDGTVSNCYDTGDFDSGSNSSPIVNKNKGTVKDAFFLDSLHPNLKNAIGTKMTQAQMKGDDLLNALNKNVAKTEGLNQWIIREGVNNGYPVFGTVPDRYSLSTDIKGKGSLAITDEEDGEISKAVSGMMVKVTAAPEEGRQVDNLKLYDDNGKTIEKLEVKPDEQGIVKTSFKMPDQDVTVHAKFTKAEKDDADKKTEDSAGTESKASQSEVKSEAAFDKAVLTDQDTGITVSGDQIDTRAVLKIEKYDKMDPQHIEIEDAASDDVLSAYDVSLALMDEKGNEIKSENDKFKGTLDVAFPIKASDKDKELKVLHGSKDGLSFEEGGLKEDGMYHVTVSHLSPFAVVDHAQDLEANLSAGETIETDSGGGSSTWIWLIVCLAAVLAAAFVIVRRVRKKR